MLRGAVVIVLLLLNTLWWGGLVLLVGFPKLFMPRSELRRRFILGLAWLGERYVGGNNRIFDLLLPVEWEGRRTIRYVDPTDEAKPKLQQAHVYFERRL